MAFHDGLEEAGFEKLIALRAGRHEVKETKNRTRMQHKEELCLLRCCLRDVLETGRF